MVAALAGWKASAVKALPREEFLRVIRAALPEPLEIDWSTELASLPSDRLFKSYLYRALAGLLNSPPSDLLKSLSHSRTRMDGMWS